MLLESAINDHSQQLFCFCLVIALRDSPGSFPDELKVLSSLNTLVVTAENIGGKLPDVYNQLPQVVTFHIKPYSPPEPSQQPTLKPSGAMSPLNRHNMAAGLLVLIGMSLAMVI